MNRWVLYSVAIVVGLVLLLFTCTYQVRFNQTAIVTTFGKAGDNSIIDDPGLHFKWPYPVQSVTTYDTRSKVLRTRLESVQTRDKQVIVVQVFVTWHIEDPLRYYQKVTSRDRAEDLIDQQLRSAQGALSGFAFTELLAQDEEESLLDDAEAAMLSVIRDPGSGEGLLEYGIAPTYVGISRFVLPQNTATSVFTRMQQTRRKLAQDARSSGAAEAARIRETAQTAAQKILSFAERRAASIRAEGEREAAEYIARQAETEDAENFAIFLRQLETLEAMIGKNTTLVIPQVWPFNLLNERPTPGQLGAPLTDPSASTAGPDFTNTPATPVELQQQREPATADRTANRSD
ncbi:MAG: protease modulator HflC [Planctomycetota bacterium]